VVSRFLKKSLSIDELDLLFEEDLLAAVSIAELIFEQEITAAIAILTEVNNVANARVRADSNVASANIMARVKVAVAHLEATVSATASNLQKKAAKGALSHDTAKELISRLGAVTQKQINHGAQAAVKTIRAQSELAVSQIRKMHPTQS